MMHEHVQNQINLGLWVSNKIGNQFKNIGDSGDAQETRCQVCKPERIPIGVKASWTQKN